MAKQTLSYHLAEALFNIIYSAGQPIYKRLNLIAFSEKCASAMLPQDERTKAQQTISALDKDILYLRNHYEPALDRDDTSFEKRVVFEMYMDDVLLDILKLISTYNLVDQKTLSEVYAAKWGSFKGGKTGA